MAALLNLSAVDVCIGQQMANDRWGNRSQKHPCFDDRRAEMVGKPVKVWWSARWSFVGGKVWHQLLCYAQP
jgi:hypothetical protein